MDFAMECGATIPEETGGQCISVWKDALRPGMEKLHGLSGFADFNARD